MPEESCPTLGSVGRWRKFLLALASTVTLSSEFCGTRHGLHRKHRLQFYCGCISCYGMVFTEPLPSTGWLLWLHIFGFQGSCHVAPFLWLWHLSLPSRMALQCHAGHEASSGFDDVQPSFLVAWDLVLRFSNRSLFRAALLEQAFKCYWGRGYTGAQSNVIL
jgi:hypothetical protein